MKLTRKKGFDRYKVIDNAKVAKMGIDNAMLSLQVVMLKAQIAIMQSPIPKFPAGGKSRLIPQSASEIIDLADKLKDAIKDSKRQVGNYESVIKPKVAYVGSIHAGMPDAHGDVLMPGAINYERRGEYKGLVRSTPTKVAIDFNPNPVDWLGEIKKDFGIVAEILKIDEHGDYKPMTEDQKNEFIDEYRNSNPTHPFNPIFTDEQVKEASDPKHWIVCDGKNTPSDEACPNIDNDTDNICHHNMQISYSAGKKQQLECSKCGKIEHKGI